MNNKTNNLKVIFVALLMTLSSSNLFAQVAQEKSETELSEFLVLIETTDRNEMKLKCTVGCAWKTLTFSLTDIDRIQAIDEFGMTDTNDENKTDKNLSDFLIAIQRTENGLSLKCVN